MSSEQGHNNQAKTLKIKPLAAETKNIIRGATCSPCSKLFAEVGKQACRSLQPEHFKGKWVDNFLIKLKFRLSKLGAGPLNKCRP